MQFSNTHCICWVKSVAPGQCAQGNDDHLAVPRLNIDWENYKRKWTEISRHTCRHILLGASPHQCKFCLPLKSVPRICKQWRRNCFRHKGHAVCTLRTGLLQALVQRGGFAGMLFPSFSREVHAFDLAVLGDPSKFWPKTPPRCQYPIHGFPRAAT